MKLIDEYPGLLPISLTRARVGLYFYGKISWQPHLQVIARLLENRLRVLRGEYFGNEEILDILEEAGREIDLYRRYSQWYGYEFYVMRKNG